jgi:hypothetical protein
MFNWANWKERKENKLALEKGKFRQYFNKIKINIPNIAVFVVCLTRIRF